MTQAPQLEHDRTAWRSQGLVLEVDELTVGIDTESGVKQAVSRLKLAISAGETFALVGLSLIHI